jgi:hypothetical protein
VHEQRPPSHPLRYDTLNRISIALLTRFSQWGWVEDCEEAFSVLNEVMESTDSTIAGHTSPLSSDTDVRRDPEPIIVITEIVLLE